MGIKNKWSAAMGMCFFFFSVLTLKQTTVTALLAKKVLEGVPYTFPHRGYGLGSHCTLCVSLLQV